MPGFGERIIITKNFFDWEFVTLAKKFFQFCFIAAIIFFGSNFCSAEDLKFVDSRDETGYYFDRDSVQIKSDSVLSVNLIVIKIDVNEMEITDLEINHARKLYTIKSTRTLSYSDRTEISADYNSRPPRGYSDRSLLSEIVTMILYGGE